ncbi:MAG: GTP-binding protein, partial [Lachnospiraceae bacterium]|nr:GTP-binding protein [Lachnospiraceae bacterium]
MSLNAVPSSERVHIGFFGCRNAGKSSLVNAVTGQDLSVVSDVRGTTTDPVMKAMELLPIGPVVIIDTPGYDDEGKLGDERVRRTRRILNRADIAVLTVDSEQGFGEADAELLDIIRGKGVPYLVVYNKTDLSSEGEHIPAGLTGHDIVRTSALTGEGIEDLKHRLGALAPKEDPGKRLLGDLISPGDLVVLVCPIDESAPKGRLILPQQQAVRDVLDS